MQLRACHYDDNTDMLTVINVEGIIYHYPATVKGEMLLVCFSFFLRW
ncbi:hypothetical protein ACFOQM_13645 [Paenibacillus sp. GCM10012307]|uniref:KTSC domain-containing protein n=1 Tax=Paenibacillus roseus TaxID=2798579 RepID=A0A934MVP5_9BACL|nr:hypothetical protein [Paenibacillus roseus]MBJ6362337.1 hypothetical protein [Paenibacillus roseus]